MIPKKIHYCWFGRNPKPALAEKCIKSWKKYCPDYEIIEWNEDNFDISACPLYVRQAYEAKKWAFVTDYVRLKVVYDNGGIYMDTDVELIKNLDSLLSNKAYFGFEDGVHIATGLGFGAIKDHEILEELMADYYDIPFILADGSFDKTTCPVRNTKVLISNGLVQNDKQQIISDNVLILPSIVLCPIKFSTEKFCKSKETISIHWFDASWLTKEEKEKRKKRMRKEKIDALIHIPNIIGKKILGEKRYEKCKTLFKR